MADMDSVHGFDSVAFESVSAVTATNSVRLGTRRLWKGEEYVYCYNAGGATITVGVFGKLVTGASGYSVAVTALTDVVCPAVGVVVHADLTTATYGWLMTKGFTTMKHHTQSAITGDYIAFAVGLNGRLTQYLPVTDAGAKGTFAVVAFGLNVNTASAGNVYGFVRTGF